MSPIFCAFILLSSFSQIFGLYDFKVEHCDGVDGAKKAIEVLGVNLPRYPFVVPGIVEGGIKFNLTRVPEAGSHYDLKLDLKKAAAEDFFTIPCIGRLGSCTLDFCEFLANNSKAVEATGDGTKLPATCSELKKGVFDLPVFKYDATNLSPLVAAFIHGDFMVDITLIKRENQEVMGCVHAEFSIVAPDEVDEDR